MQRASRGVALALGAVAAFSLGMATDGGTTYASLSDFDSVPASASAGVWGEDLADPPDACNEVLRLPHTSLTYGTEAGESLPKSGAKPPQGNHPQVIMALGGNDVLSGGNQRDCLVGGPGDDRLVGGNGKDHLDGGPGWDVCEGENGKDTVVGCERITDTLPAQRSVRVGEPASVAPRADDSAAASGATAGTKSSSPQPPAKAEPPGPAADPVANPVANPVAGPSGDPAADQTGDASPSSDAVPAP